MTTPAGEQPTNPTGIQPGDGMPALESGDGAPAPVDGAAPAGAEGSEGAAPAPGVRYFKDEHRDEIRQRIRARRAESRKDPSLAEAAAAVAATAADPGPAESQDSDASASATTNGDGSGQPAAPSPAAPAPAPVASAFTRVKINGQQLDVPTEEVNAAGGVAPYQILKAAEISLRNAQTIENQLRDLRTQAAQPAPVAPTAAPSPGGKPAPSGTAAGVSKEVAQELLEGVLESDAERIARALGKMGAQPSPPPAAPAPAPQPAARPANPTRNRQEIDAANVVFDQEFAHLRQQPAAFQLARNEILAKMKDPQFAAFPLDMLVRDIGSRVGRMAGVAPSATPAQPSPATQQALADRRTAKARLPISSSASGKVPVAPAAPTPTRKERNANYVSQLRARSGSNTAISEQRTATR